MEKKKDIFVGGKHAVFETIKLNSNIINYIVCTEKNYSEISKLLKKYNKFLKIQIWDTKKIDSIFDEKFSHQNYACSIKSNFFKNYKELGANTKEIVIFEEMYDFRNVGSMIRSGLAFGIKDYFFSKKNTKEKFDKIFKSSSGYVASVNIYKYSNLSSLIKNIKDMDFWFFGLDGDEGSHSIYEINWPKKIAIIIGNENFGLKKLTKSCCDYLVKIPISNEVESLNVSSAFAIAMAIKKRP